MQFTLMLGVGMVPSYVFIFYIFIIFIYLSLSIGLLLRRAGSRLQTIRNPGGVTFPMEEAAELQDRGLPWASWPVTTVGKSEMPHPKLIHHWYWCSLGGKITIAQTKTAASKAPASRKPRHQHPGNPLRSNTSQAELPVFSASYCPAVMGRRSTPCSFVLLEITCSLVAPGTCFHSSLSRHSKWVMQIDSRWQHMSVKPSEMQRAGNIRVFLTI